MDNNGQGAPQDKATAVSRRRRKAADQGDADAQYSLASLYDTGLGVPQDYAAAASWLRKAADQGHATAQYNLGVMYENGRGVPQDYAAAVSWYRKAANRGNASAQYNLGVMYRRGEGVRQDYVQAYKWIILSTSRTTRADLRVENQYARQGRRQHDPPTNCCGAEAGQGVEAELRPADSSRYRNQPGHEKRQVSTTRRK